ncbi:MAG: hypothetical protein IJC46_03515 [Clostridia bacterium]|nr:hypothetical protein [Clostridia bacterium]
MICPKCNQQLPEGALHCPFCGEALRVQAQPQAAPVPPAMAPNGTAPAPQPEYAMPQPEYAMPQPEYTMPQPEYPMPNSFEAPAPEKKKMNLKPIIIALIALIVVGVGGFFAFKFFFSDTSGYPNYVLYEKNGKLYYSDLSEDGGVKITSDFDSEYGDGLQMSKDGSTLYYPTDISEGSYELWSCDVSDPEGAERIAKNVREYFLLENDEIIFLKDNGKLYRYDGEEAELAKDVASVQPLTLDGELIIYYTEEERKATDSSDEYDEYDDYSSTIKTYYLIKGSDTEELGSDIRPEGATKDMGTFFYTDADGNMFKKKFGGDAEKLVSDTKSTYAINAEKGTFYFTREAEGGSGALAYFDDDMASSDAALTEPVEPVYPDYDAFDSYDAYSAAYEQYSADYTAYREAYYAYQDKLERDALRVDLKEATLDAGGYSLYYYNGSEEVAVGNSVASISTLYNYDSIDNFKSVITYKQYDDSGVTKLKMSELTYYDVDSVVYKIEDQLSGSYSFGLASEGTAVSLGSESIDDTEVSSDYKTVYYSIEPKAEGENDDYVECDIYKLSIDGTPGNPEEAGEGYRFRLIGDKLCVYADRDSEDGSFELFVDGTSITDDAFGVDDIDGEIYVHTDEKNDEYTLNRLNGTELEMICEDVNEYTISEDGTVYVVSDEKEDEYTLSYVDGDEMVEIAEDVCDYWFTPGGELVFGAEPSGSEYDLFYWDGSEAIQIDSNVRRVYNYTYYFVEEEE